RRAVIERVRLRLVRVACAARYAQALREVVGDVHERGLVVRRVAVVSDEIQQASRVVECLELGRVVSAALGFEGEESRGPAEPLIPTGGTVELQLDLLL